MALAVFPTGVGVYRLLPDIEYIKDRFPHRRGGVPPTRFTVLGRNSVFPTGVGVYRD